MPEHFPQRLVRVRRTTRRLMDALGKEHLGQSLTARGWSFTFDRARRRAGCCYGSDKVITLSPKLSVEMPWGDIEDVIRHEIAHALDFEHRGHSGHDEDWKIWALYCGARPQRCYSFTPALDPDAPYRGSCPRCDYARDFYRQPIRAYSCRSCKRPRSWLRIVHARTGALIREGGAQPGPFLGWAGYSARCNSCGKVHLVARHCEHACGRCCEKHADGQYDERFRLRYRSNAHRKPSHV